MKNGKNEPKSLIMLITAMLIFGTVGTIRKMIPLPSPLIALCRGSIGALLLLAFSTVTGKHPFKNLRPKTALLLLLSGAIIGLNWSLLFEAYRYTSVSVAVLCYYMQPIIVILLSALLFGEKLTWKKALCAAAALVGMVLISGVLDRGLPQSGERRGILFALGAACLYATVVLMNKRITGVDPYAKTILQLSAAAVVQVPYLLMTGGFAGNDWSGWTLPLLLLLCVVHTGFCYLLWFGSMDGLTTQTVALFSYIDPVTALLVSGLVLGETMTVLGWLGAVLILGAAILSGRE